MYTRPFIFDEITHKATFVDIWNKTKSSFIFEKGIRIIYKKFLILLL